MVDPVSMPITAIFGSLFNTPILALVASPAAEQGAIGWRLLFALFLVFLNGFFVAAEFAIVKVRASQIEIKAKTTVVNISDDIIFSLDINTLSIIHIKREYKI